MKVDEVEDHLFAMYNHEQKEFPLPAIGSAEEVSNKVERKKMELSQHSVLNPSNMHCSL